MKKYYSLVVFLWIITPFFSSCVSKKKYKQLAYELELSNQENNKLNENIVDYKSEIDAKKSKISELNKRIDSLRTVRLNLIERNSFLEENRKKSENDLLNEINSLTTELNKSIVLYNELVEKMKYKEEFNKKLMLELEESSTTIAEKQKKLNELNLKVKENELSTRLLREKIINALTMYGSEDVTVEMQNGKIHVVMNDKLLFQSGKTEVNAKGKEVLKSLAGSLKNIHDFDVYVEGHTDDLSIKTNCLKDNWDLSVLRATSVVRYLVFQGGMNPSHVIASGRGPFASIMSNNTPEGRAMNRRTEIILIPKIGQVLDIINK
jgi:chemotaxis protein MotB